MILSAINWPTQKMLGASLLCILFFTSGCLSTLELVVGDPLRRSWNTHPSVSAAPLTKEESAKFIEVAIRKRIKKPVGELTDVDLEKVTRLVLNNNQLTEVPKVLEKLTKLKELWLEGNQLTDVKGLEKLTQLEKLYLNNNQLTDVMGLEKLTKLKGLSLNDNQLTNVRGLEKLTQLTHLHLYGNKLTRAQIEQLQKALPKCKILSNPTK